MICPNCRAENPDDGRFCTSCGAALPAGPAPSPDHRAARARVPGRAAPAHGHVLRPRRLDRALGAARPGGSARGHGRLSDIRRRDRHPLRRLRRRLHGRRRAGLFRLSAGARARCRARRARRPGAGRQGLSSATGPRGVAPQVRIGIATGLVVVGNLAGADEAQQHGIVGGTPNLAARLQALAEPDTVVIEPARAAYRRAVRLPRPRRGDAQGFRRAGAGVAGRGRRAPAAEPLRGAARGRRRRRCSAATRSSSCCCAAGSRPRAARAGSSCSRARPASASRAWRTALLERIAGEPHLRLRYFCSPHHTDSALHPVIAQLERAAGFERDDGRAAEARQARGPAGLRRAVGRRRRADRRAAVARRRRRRYPRLDLAPQQRKQKTLDALRRLVEAPSRRRPIVAIFEDVHWIDPTSLELLDRLVERGAAAADPAAGDLPARLRAAVGRPAARHALALNRLGRPPAAALVGRFGGDGLPRRRGRARSSSAPTACRCSSRS